MTWQAETIGVSISNGVQKIWFSFSQHTSDIIKVENAVEPRQKTVRQNYWVCEVSERDLSVAETITFVKIWNKS